MITYHATATRPEIRVVEHDDKAPKRQYDQLFSGTWDELVQLISTDQRRRFAVLYSVSLGGKGSDASWAIWRHE